MISADQIQASGVIKSSYNKQKMKQAIIEYIKEYLKTKSTTRNGENLLHSLRKLSGLTPIHESKATGTGEAGPSQPRPSRDPPPRRSSDDQSQVEEEETYEDEITLDPLATEVALKFPTLPRIPCPKDLFISTLQFKYLSSLFLADRTSYLNLILIYLVSP